MRMDSKFVALFFMVLLIGGPGFPTLSLAEDRPFYEYPGNYRDQVNTLKEKFQTAFGYELVDMDELWKPREIEMMHEAFFQLPESFYGLKGFNALYRLSRFRGGPENIASQEVPAATLPSFQLIYRKREKSYHAYMNDEDPRTEFYNALFYENREDFFNIVHHEMAHAFDLSHGFLTFLEEWITLSHFRPIHQPALDGKADSDFMFTFLNDPEVNTYAPISTRHMPTYSRISPQEDFANAVAGYLHYPYFRYSHPARYAFLKARVFAGKEYFNSGDAAGDYEKKLLEDFDLAARERKWADIRRILTEASRFHAPELEAELVARLEAVAGTGRSPQMDLQLGLSSCYLSHPKALEFRKNLIRQQRLKVDQVLGDSRCRRGARDMFEKTLGKRPLGNLFFFREDGRDILQFMDPVLITAHSRGFHTRYLWRISLEGSTAKPLLRGTHVNVKGGNGSLTIDLQKTADKPAPLPEGRALILEIGAERSHGKTFKTIQSESSNIRFVIQPGFQYEGPMPPKIRVVYPLRPGYSHLH